MSGLRVGLVCPYSLAAPGGVQNHVLGLARELRRLGHQPRVLAPGRLGAEADPELRRLVASAGAGVPVRYNGSVARVNFGPRSHARVAAWLARERVDVLHVHEPVTPSVALLALREARAVPVVATFHTATPGSTAMRLAGRALGPMIDRIDLGLAVSSSARSVVRRHLGLDPMIIPNGVRVADFAGPRAEPGRAPRVTLLGRLDEERKGLPVFLRALPRIRAARPDAEIVVAGPGRTKLPGGVRRTGLISDAERSALLRGTDVFVAPNLARESFGLILVEALAAGARVVASDLPAFRAVLAEGGGRAHGATVPPGDHRALADAVVSALDRPPAPPAGRAHARRYDWSEVAPQILQAYRTAIRMRTRAAGIA